VNDANKDGCSDLPSIFIHNDRHTRCIQAIPLGHQTLPEPIRNVIGAEETRDNDRQVRRDDRERGNVPVLEYFTFEFQVARFAAGEGGTGVACVGGGCLDEGGEVAAAVELGSVSDDSTHTYGGQTHLVLNPQSTLQAQNPTPLRVDFSLEVESMLLVRQIPRCNDQRKACPKEDIVCSEESPIVEDDAGEAQECCEKTQGSGGCRDCG
jgi:hypothetical protein